MAAAAAARPEAARVELWFADGWTRQASNRVGRKGRVTRVWSGRGVRPRAARDLGFASADLFGAACPGRGAGVALALPEASTAAMDLLLAESGPAACRRGRTPSWRWTGPATTSRATSRCRRT